jgi:hypothetical protein
MPAWAAPLHATTPTSTVRPTASKETTRPPEPPAQIPARNPFGTTHRALEYPDRIPAPTGGSYSTTSGPKRLRSIPTIGATPMTASLQRQPISRDESPPAWGSHRRLPGASWTNERNAYQLVGRRAQTDRRCHRGASRSTSLLHVIKRHPAALHPSAAVRVDFGWFHHSDHSRNPGRLTRNPRS